ncbi:unnamed protein product [Trichobilharzia regenti]|nr:unnamed protein product [Trichobilharzia regenti]
MRNRNDSTPVNPDIWKILLPIRRQIGENKENYKTQIFKGYLDDQLNADSAWMETVVINLHESESKGAQLPDDILKLLNEPGTEEQVKWIEVSHSSNLRTSHNYILKNVAELRRAFY